MYIPEETGGLRSLKVTTRAKDRPTRNAFSLTSRGFRQRANREVRRMEDCFAEGGRTNREAQCR
jgi:hypothetical protein